jgi:uncharacterized repeat protein (TIGR01451 family)
MRGKIFHILFALVLLLVMMAYSYAMITPQTSQASNGVEIQVAMLLDGSASITSEEWTLMVNGLAGAIDGVSCQQRSATSNTGTFTNPTDAYADGGNYAQATNGMVHDYHGYGFTIPGGATIRGIEVRLDAWRQTGRTGSIGVELSWNGGTDWTSTGYGTGSLTGSQSSRYAGSPTSLWGHNWTPSQVNTGLRVRLSVTATGWVRLDWVPVTVCYQTEGCVPLDGSVELTVIQFSTNAQVEVAPVVMTETNAGDVADDIRNISQMAGYTCASCGICLAADTLAASSNFDPDIKQAVNLVTDGDPNRCSCSDGTCGYSGSSCDLASAQASTECARAYALATLEMTTDQDEIDVEGIAITDTNRDWFKNNIIFPATGYSSPPESWPPPGPGWVRVVANADDFAETICEKFEIVVYGSITAHKFNDLNLDGDQDGGEDNLEGWTMTLYSGPDCSGGSLASNATNTDGDVVFTGLEAGTYSVKETLKGGWTNSTALCQQVTIDAGESAALNFGNLCIPPTAAFNATPTSGCAPLTVTFTDQSTGSPTSWNWTFGDGGTSSLQNPSHQYASAGTYNVTLTASNACGSDTETKTNYITVYTKPTATASSNSPVCEGATIQLTGGPDGMTTYSWTGPGGWTNSAQNATRPNATPAMAGNYTLTVTDSNGCSDDETTDVTVNAKPSATASSNSPLCEGATIQLTGGPDGMTTYSWTGPGGWTSGAQNATRPNATPAMAGNYTLTVTDNNGCSDDGTTDVTVNAKPTATASSNSPVCEGATIALTGGPGGMTSYNWTGPNSFSSSLQSPTIPNATLAMAGTYYLTVTDGGCTSDPASMNVVVNAKPTATASSNSPVCEGATIQLTGGPDGMTTYSWTGPGGWTSSAQNATRPNATPAMAGNYTLTVTDSNGCSDDGTADVTVNAKPTATASSNSPLCEGATIQLTGGPDGMTTYSWTGPGGFSSSAQNATRPNATTNITGTYTLTVTDSNGCSDDESTSVTVNAKPTATASSNSPVCEGATIQLTGGPDDMATYSWTGPGGWTSSLQNPTRSNATLAMAGTYYLTVTDGGCTSDPASTVVVVNVCAPVVEATKNDELWVDWDGSTDFSPGDTIKYTVVINNSGGGTAQNVVFTDTADPNTTLLCGTVTTTQGTIICPSGLNAFSVAVGDITAEGQVTITFQASIDKPWTAEATQVFNLGSVSGANFATEPTDDPATPAEDDPTVTLLSLVALDPAKKSDGLLIDADGNGVASPGDTLWYEVTIWNEGTLDATGVIFTDTPDPNTTLLWGAVTTTKGTVTIGNNDGDTSVEVEVGILLAGGPASETVTISFYVTINDPLPEGVTHVYNQGVFTSNEGPSEPTDDPDTSPDDDPTGMPLGPAGPGPSPAGRGVPVFPNIYLGVVVALGAGILAYFVRRRLISQR